MWRRCAPVPATTPTAGFPGCTRPLRSPATAPRTGRHSAMSTSSSPAIRSGSRCRTGASRIAWSETRIVDPSACWVTQRGRDRLVLTSCHPPFSAAQRIVVFARLATQRDARRGGTSRFGPLAGRRRLGRPPSGRAAPLARRPALSTARCCAHMAELSDAFRGRAGRHRHARGGDRGLHLEPARHPPQAVRRAQRPRLLRPRGRVPRPAQESRRARVARTHAPGWPCGQTPDAIRRAGCLRPEGLRCSRVSLRHETRRLHRGAIRACYGRCAGASEVRAQTPASVWRSGRLDGTAEDERVSSQAVVSRAASETPASRRKRKRAPPLGAPCTNRESARRARSGASRPTYLVSPTERDRSVSSAAAAVR